MNWRGCGIARPVTTCLDPAMLGILDHQVLRRRATAHAWPQHRVREGARFATPAAETVDTQTTGRGAMAAFSRWYIAPLLNGCARSSGPAAGALSGRIVIRVRSVIDVSAFAIGT